MYDRFSIDILALSPLPFNVCFGECAPKHYKRAPIHGQRRLLTVSLTLGTDLDIDLRFNAGKMKRMTVIIEHPATVFLGRPAGESLGPNGRCSHALALSPEEGTRSVCLSEFVLSESAWSSPSCCPHRRDPSL